MEQLCQIGEALGNLKVLMVFQDEIRINQRQCCLLSDAYNMAFEIITDEIKHNLKFEEKLTKWDALENPLRELLRIIKEGKQYIRQCIETKDWWTKAITLNQNTDCIGFHIHNLLLCMSIVLEAIENAGEISGCDHEVIYKKRLILSKKYDREWMDSNLFQIKFGKTYLVSQEMCKKYESVMKEDKWILLEAVSEKKNSSSLSKHDNQIAELLSSPKGKLFPVSVLINSKDYQVRKRLGNGSRYKEVQWMGENFVLGRFSGDVKQLATEISNISSISHPNVMSYMYAFSDEDKKECLLVMELMNKDLSSYIKEICCTRRRIPFPLIVAVDIMLQIAWGMEYMHSLKVYHGDLNPSNILVRCRNSSPDGYLHVKVSGYGLLSESSNSKGSRNSQNFPCIWYAPEVLNEQEKLVESRKYSEKADVYSFSMICFELLTGKIPFEEDHLQGEKMSRNIRAGERPLFPFPSPKYLTSLTKRCWQTDPMQRPSFSSICRVLRYIKKYLIVNMDRNPHEIPGPSIDYFDIEASLSKKFKIPDSMNVLEIPFQMFSFRVVEREKATVNLKEKSSESGSEGASTYDEENNGFNLTMIQEYALSSPLPSSIAKSLSHSSLEIYNKTSSPRRVNSKANKQTGQNQAKGGVARPPPLLKLRGRSLRLKSDNNNHLTPPAVMTPGRRRISGHKSDSEILR